MKESEKPKSITKAFDELRDAIGKHWDGVDCICEAMLKDKCSLNCPSHSDNQKENNPSSTT